MLDGIKIKNKYFFNNNYTSSNKEKYIIVLFYIIKIHFLFENIFMYTFCYF